MLSATTICAILATTPAGPDAFVYHYYKQPIHLEVDHTRVASVTRQVQARDGAIARGHQIQFVDTPLPQQPVAQIVEATTAQEPDRFVSPVFVDRFGGPIVILPTIYVGFAPHTPDHIAIATIDRAELGEITHHDYLGLDGVFRINSASHDAIDLLSKTNALLELPFVRFAEPNMFSTAHQTSNTPNDPLFCEAWGLENTGTNCLGGAIGTAGMDLNALDAWKITTGHPDVITAVIDLGTSFTHPDLAPNLIPGTDVTTDFTTGGNPGPNDGSAEGECDWHGTAVTGCIVALADNGIGAAGIAPGTKAVPIRAFEVFHFSVPTLCRGVFSQHSLINEVEWQCNALAFAEQANARITNNSNDVALFSTILAEKYKQTRADGMIHFVSAGNDGSNDVGFPGTAPAVNAVSSTDRDGAIVGFSNTGPDVDFAAPGLGIITTDREGDSGYCHSNGVDYSGGTCPPNGDADYALVNGTSFSSPYAAGVAALVISRAIELPAGLVVSDTPGDEIGATQTEAVLRFSANNAEPPVFDPELGWGSLDALAALTLLEDCNNSLASLTPTDDADGNGLRDACEIIANPSLDCNENTRLDATEPAFSDCNGNGINDACEIFELTAEDCNANGIPDDCEADANGDGLIDNCDCNGNGQDDAFELLLGTADDCDRDGLIDSCACICNVIPDNVVDILDLTSFLGAWFQQNSFAEITCELPPVVDIDDLLKFLGCWMPANAGEGVCNE